MSPQQAQADAIVGGVDDTPDGDAALAFAVHEATATGEALHVVTAWRSDWPPMFMASGVPISATPVSEHEQHVLAEQVQDAAIARSQLDRASLRLTTEVVEGATGPVLVAASRGARLLVVGSRGRGPVAAALLGSVSRYCAQHATCPVVVVPVVADVAVVPDVAVSAARTADTTRTPADDALVT